MLNKNIIFWSLSITFKRNKLILSVCQNRKRTFSSQKIVTAAKQISAQGKKVLHVLSFQNQLGTVCIKIFWEVIVLLRAMKMWKLNMECWLIIRRQNTRDFNASNQIHDRQPSLRKDQVHAQSKWINVLFDICDFGRSIEGKILIVQCTSF